MRVWTFSGTAFPHVAPPSGLKSPVYRRSSTRTIALPIDLLPVRELDAVPRTFPDPEDLQGLRGHHPARREMVQVPMTHDGTRRLPARVEDDLAKAVLDPDAAVVRDAHQPRLVNTYRVGTRLRSPVQ